MKAHDGMYIDGEWRPAAGQETIAVVNPADEQVIGHVPAGTRGGRGPGGTGRPRRVPGLGRHRARRTRRPARGAARCAGRPQDEIAETVTAELGAPLAVRRRRCTPAARRRWRVPTPSWPPRTPSRSGSATRPCLHEPVGVVGAITPWNYPLHQIVAKVAPALAAGCTVVLKPAEVTPLTAQLFAEAAHEAGLPAGVFNLVTGLGPVAGQALAEHAGVDLVSFTGSTAVGRQIGAVAGGGGQAGRARARRQVRQRDPAERRPGHGGQGRGRQRDGQLRPDLQRLDPDAGARATATTRPSTLAGGRRRQVRAGRAASARWSTPRSASGSAATSSKGVARAPGWSRAAPSAAGARLLRRPTVFADVTPDMTIAQEEIFGPVLVDHPLRGRRRRAADRQRHGVRAGRRGLVRRRGGSGGLRPADAHRSGRHQRRPVQPARPVRRLQAVRRRPRAGPARAGRVPPDQVAPVLTLSPARYPACPRPRSLPLVRAAVLPAVELPLEIADIDLPAPGPRPGAGPAGRRRGLPLRPVAVQRHPAQPGSRRPRP